MIKKSFIILVIALSTQTSNLYAQATPPEQAPAKTMTMDHSHLPIAVPSDVKTPAISLEIYEDAMSGYNLHIKTQHYNLTPPPLGVLSMADLMSVSINKKTGFVEGHAHLYINGIKIQRVYGADLHIPAKHFKSGINTVSVTLNNHGHMFWTAQDKKIVSTLYIDASLPDLIKHKFESFPVSK
ncbi:hypothetical protein ACPUVO_04125 [Pseudocolwellia sp. HL-MZ19]|uniref:hypothetical protein n=1 Tax=unclassified Pseudocolwellia TaxID=2848178 RepID=UPI003CF1DC4A